MGSRGWSCRRQTRCPDAPQVAQEPYSNTQQQGTQDASEAEPCEAKMIRTFGRFAPRIASTAYVDEAAQVIGDVVLGEHVSIWPGAILRGDLMPIRIGDCSN